MEKADEPTFQKGKLRAGQTVGYPRVSALDQKQLRQIEGFDLEKRITELQRLSQSCYLRSPKY